MASKAAQVSHHDNGIVIIVIVDRGRPPHPNGKIWFLAASCKNKELSDFALNSLIGWNPAKRCRMSLYAVQIQPGSVGQIRRQACTLMARRSTKNVWLEWYPCEGKTLEHTFGQEPRCSRTSPTGSSGTQLASILTGLLFFFLKWTSTSAWSEKISSDVKENDSGHLEKRFLCTDKFPTRLTIMSWLNFLQPNVLLWYDQETIVR